MSHRLDLEGRLQVLAATRLTPAADPAVLARALAARAAGRRVELPVHPAPRRISMQWLLIGGVAAGLGALALSQRELHAPARSAQDSTAEHALPSPADLSADWFLPAAALAQSPGPVATTNTDGSRLRAGTWTYAVRSRWGVSIPPLSVTEITLAQTTFEDQNAWLLIQRQLRAPDSLPIAEWDGHTPAESLPPEAWRWRKVSNLPQAFAGSADTVWLAGADLLPLARVAAREGYRREERYHEDHATVSITTGSFTETRSIGRLEVEPVQAAGLMLRQDVLLAQLQGLPLTRDYRGTVNGVALGWQETYLITAVDLAVTGEERVTVPAGTFDCWRVQVGPMEGLVTLWVAKDGQWLVRQATGGMVRGGFEQVLTEMRLGR